MTEYKILIGQMNWLVNHSRPDCAFEVSKGSNTNINSSQMRKLIKNCEKLKNTECDIILQNLIKEKKIYKCIFRCIIW